MSKQKPFKPGQGYTKEDWEAVQSPELTDEQMARAKPFAEAFPNLASSIRRGRCPKTPKEGRCPKTPKEGVDS